MAMPLGEVQGSLQVGEDPIGGVPPGAPLILGGRSILVGHILPLLPGPPRPPARLHRKALVPPLHPPGCQATSMVPNSGRMWAPAFWSMIRIPWTPRTSASVR
jgi:hypothetical protein